MNFDFIITDIERIIFVGGEEFREPHSVFSPDLAYNELIFELSEEDNEEIRSEMLFGDGVYAIHPNMIRFLPAGHNGRYEVERYSRRKGCIDIFFSTDRPLSASAEIFDRIRNRNIEELFRKAFAVWAAKGEGFRFECISYLYRIFAELQKIRYMPADKYDRIRPAISYIENRFREEMITADQLAECCGISYSYLKRLFLERFQVTPQKYVSNMRINYACDLLSTGDYSVEAVAASAGYSSIYYFSRQFKNIVGITPTEYIRKCRSSK